MNLQDGVRAARRAARRQPARRRRRQGQRRARGASVGNRPRPPPPTRRCRSTIGQGDPAGRPDHLHRSLDPARPTPRSSPTSAARISGLSSAAGSTADVDLRGRDQPLGRAGDRRARSTRWPRTCSLDMRVDAQGRRAAARQPLHRRSTPATAISKGKLDLALDYKIANRSWTRRTSWSSTSSRSATRSTAPMPSSCPCAWRWRCSRIGTASSTSSCRSRARSTIPSSRSGRAILKVLGNLVVKAVTAPFSLIASAFGGGDELSHIDFAAGAATLDASARRSGSRRWPRRCASGRGSRSRSKAAPIPSATARASAGSSSSASSRRGSSRRWWRPGRRRRALDDIKIEPAERPSLIEAAYKTEKFPKPKNALGFEKGLPPSEMEKLMLANTRVENDDLRALALAPRDHRPVDAGQGGPGRRQPALPRRAARWAAAGASSSS